MPGIGRLGIEPALRGRGYPPASNMVLWHIAMMQHVIALPPYASPPSHESAPPPRGRLEPPAPLCSTAPPATAVAGAPEHGGREGAAVWMASGQGALCCLIPLCIDVVDLTIYKL